MKTSENDIFCKFLYIFICFFVCFCMFLYRFRHWFLVRSGYRRRTCCSFSVSFWSLNFVGVSDFGLLFSPFWAYVWRRVHAKGASGSWNRVVFVIKGKAKKKQKSKKRRPADVVEAGLLFLLFCFFLLYCTLYWFLKNFRLRRSSVGSYCPGGGALFQTLVIM